MLLANVFIIISFVFLLYTFIGYPIIIFTLSKLFMKKVKIKNDNKCDFPVTIVMVIHNEVSRIVKKTQNLLDLSYPKDKINIIIVNDGSTDGSLNEINNYKSQNKIVDNKILLLKQDKKGKISGINLAIKYIKNNYSNNDNRLVMFCDVRQEIEKDALKQMALLFTDESVTYVCGNLILPFKEGPGLYWKYEQMIRKAESNFKSLIGGAGHLSLVKLDLIPELPEDLILDDVYIPLYSIFNNKRVIFEETAKAYDIECKVEGELKRKYRTLTGNYQLIAYLPRVLNIFKNPIGLQYWSHKVFRLIAPYFLIIFLICSFISLLQGSDLGLITFIAQIIFYVLSFLSKFSNSKFLKIAKTFTLLNFAAVIGLIRFLKKDYRWTSAKDIKKNN